MASWAAAIFLTVLVILSPFAAAQEYPELEDYVTDLAHALDDFEEKDIADLCDTVYWECGAEIAVLVVNTTYPSDINTYATRTFQDNGLGQEGKDNGLLILVVTDTSEWRVEVGYGLEAVLPDARVANFTETYLVPCMEEDLYGTGICDLVNNMGGAIQEEYDGEPPKDPHPIPFIPLTFWQLVIVVVIIAFLTVITRGRIFFFLPYLIGKGGGKNWGGGRTGGGGAGGRWK